MKTVLNIKTDKEIKERAQRLAKYLGVPLSTVVNAQLKAFVESGEFTLKREPALQPEVIRKIKEQLKDSDNKRNVSPAFSSAEEAISWLRS